MMLKKVEVISIDEVGKFFNILIMKEKKRGKKLIFFWVLYDKIFC